MSPDVALSRSTLDALTSWYARHDVPGPLRAADPRVVRRARTICGGDWRRVTIDPDGSLVVWNWPVWSRSGADPDVRPLPVWAR